MPPPRQLPLMAAMTGVGSCSRALNQRCTSMSFSTKGAFSVTVKSWVTSAPAMKFLPVPVMITAL